jgi:H+/gluconate symporter-like permease
MSFLPLNSRSGRLVGLYLVNAVVAPLPILYGWTAANFSGATKRAFSAAVVSGSFSIGNNIGPQTFQARDAPDYRPAKLAVMGTQAGCAIVTIALYGYYRWENRRRDKRDQVLEKGEEGFLERETWATVTDRENPQFRYVY